MLDQHKDKLSGQLESILIELGYQPVSPQWRSIPFQGEWGLGTAIAHRLSNQELEGRDDLDKKARSKAARERVPAIASEIAGKLQKTGLVSRAEAQSGYVNVFFDVPQLAAQLIDHVLTGGRDYGRGPEKSKRVMIEYSQPNTHKAFHVGHLRNVCLGHSLGRLLSFAGFDTIKANYIGDIGMHVIRCMWCYSRFHDGQEPAESRGKWLGQIYVEAGQRLDLRSHVAGLLNDLVARPDFRQRFHRWTEASDLGELTRRRLVYALDKEVREAADQLRAKLGRAPAEDRPAAVREALGGGAAAGGEVLRFLKEVASDEDPSAAIGRIVDQDGVAEAIREHVPQLWPEVGNWIREADDSKNLELYEVFERRMPWWPRVDQWRNEVKEFFGRWDSRDAEVVALWERTRKWSMDEFLEIYDFLGAEFDEWFYESQVEEEGKEIVADMIAKGIAEDNREAGGPVVVHIDKLLGAAAPTSDEPALDGEFRTLVVLRSDGTSLYSTKDLALAKRKYEDFHVDYSIYVVDARQAFYFRQVFKTLQLWGFDQAKDCYHLAYEIVTDPTGTMSSRAGRVVPFEDFALTAVERAGVVVEAKNPQLDESKKKEIARAIAVGAMRYSMLSADDNKVIVFDLEQALAFEGRSAPYVQYAHARSCRILEKAGGLADAKQGSFRHLASASDGVDSEISLIEKIGEFPALIQRAAADYKPHMVAAYLFELASLYSEFYQKCDVMRGDVDEEIRVARILLVRACRQTLENGLWILGIEAPEVM